MISPHDLKLCRELKRRLLKAAKLVDIRVFGSRARGDNDEFSDLDVFIEVDHLNRSVKSRIREITWETGLAHSVVITPMIFSKKEIEDSALRSSPLVKVVLLEGIPV